MCQDQCTFACIIHLRCKCRCCFRNSGIVCSNHVCIHLLKAKQTTTTTTTTLDSCTVSSLCFNDRTVQFEGEHRFPWYVLLQQLKLFPSGSQTANLIYSTGAKVRLGLTTLNPITGLDFLHVDLFISAGIQRTMQLNCTSSRGLSTCVAQTAVLYPTCHSHICNQGYFQNKLVVWHGGGICCS